MNISYILEYFLATFGLLSGSSNGQDRIIFRDDDDESFQGRNLLTPVKIPERLLIQMKDIRNVEEFLNRFVEAEANLESSDSAKLDINGTEKIGLFGRGATPRQGAPSPIARPAACQTEDHIVELQPPGNGALLLWPSCVRVRRCGGCCTSKMLSCSPVATSIVNVTVLELVYDPQNPDTFDAQGQRVFSLEQHDRCACNCKQQADSCSALQEFREDECRCVCPNDEHSSRCTGPKKIWDISECACKCRRIMHCSTGSYFNPIKCRCESRKRSLAAKNSENRNSSTLARAKF